jgi:hypothetical protein
VRDEPFFAAVTSPESDDFFLRKTFGLGLVLSMDWADDDDPEPPRWLVADFMDVEVDEGPHDCA